MQNLDKWDRLQWKDLTVRQITKLIIYNVLISITPFIEMDYEKDMNRLTEKFLEYLNNVDENK